ncbi:copper-binding protein [Streptomyces sp. NPDC006430]|uniref:copper-binding protein n=1 Tax=Streptomyces sp. NPDC006430 TaxID=3154299 RepID=UPI0033AFCC64
MTGTLTHRRMGPALAAGVLAGVLAGCGGGGGGSTAPTVPPPTRSAQSAATHVTADLSDFHIALSQKTFAAGAYTFTVKNTGHHDHALEVEGPGGDQRSKTLAPGESGTFDITLKNGSYELYCPVDGHKDLGMKTEITVGGAVNGY